MGKTRRAVVACKDNNRKQKVKGKQRHQGRHSYVSDQEFELYLLRTHGLQIHLMRGDGNCLFRSIAHQLKEDPEQRHYAIRAAVIAYMERHSEFYSLFVEDDVSWDDYIDSMKTAGTWGGYQELCAASSAFNLSIHVYQWNEPKYVIQPTELSPTVPCEGSYSNMPRRVIMLSFHDGCHYNSLLPADLSLLEKDTVGLNEAASSLPPKKERKSDNAVISRENIIENIGRAVNWVTMDDILTALEWTDNDENEAIELLCSHLYNIRAMQKASLQSTEVDKNEKLSDSTMSISSDNAFTIKAKDDAPQNVDSSPLEESAVRPPDVADSKIVTSINGRILSKKEARQKERQDRENAKRKPQIIIKPAVIITTKKINNSQSTKLRSTASGKDSTDPEDDKAITDSMREIVL